MQTSHNPYTTRPEASSEIVRQNMRRQGTRDTSCEMAVRRALHRRGHRFRVDFRPLQSERFRADIGWKGRRVAVFIDGCYWHQCPVHGTVPKTNSNWWGTKFAANSERDQRVRDVLENHGWTVLRYWEHEDPETVADQITRHLL